MSYAEYMMEDRRLVVLRALYQEADRRLNEAVLQRVLEGFGHRVARHAVREVLDWLVEVRAIRVETFGSGQVYIAELLERGEDHVAGRTLINGIARPSASSS
ncbi:hypothetical protein [Pyruvatibacter sp.]|uniref:VpaChn25_0724 family phage protein n=1 Tax=Pyruvatibacter sp. TaxID=1981328 RepID=UPI0032F0514E